MTAAIRTPRRPARAKVVGSLLRPPRLPAAMDELYAPGHLMAYAEDRARDRSSLTAVPTRAPGGTACAAGPRRPSG